LIDFTLTAVLAAGAAAGVAVAAAAGVAALEAGAEDCAKAPLANIEIAIEAVAILVLNFICDCPGRFVLLVVRFELRPGNTQPGQNVLFI
jgi:hypothetical protein